MKNETEKITMVTDPRLTEKRLELQTYCEQNHLPDEKVPLIVFNSAFHSSDNLEVPPELFSYLKRNGPIVDVCIRESLLTLPPNFVITDQQKQDFQRGIPVVFSGMHYLTVDERNRGGQGYEAIERHIKSTLDHVCHALIERLCEFEKAREGRKKLTPDSRRRRVIKQIASKLGESYSAAPPDSEKRISFLTTCYSGAPKRGYIAYYHTDNLKSDIEIWTSVFLNLSELEQQEEIEFQLLQIISLLRCKKRAEQLKMAKGDEAEAIAKDQPVSRSRLIAIGGTRCDIHVDVFNLLPAAFAGDFNLVELFQVHDGSNHYFIILQKLGQLARGRKNVEFTIDEARILDDILDIVERYREPAWQGGEDQTREAAFWHKALTASMPLPFWYRHLHAPSMQPFLERN